jgi:outer membrane murein-binding lipoprotein Lpp
MKKIILAAVVITCLGGCFIFQKKEKLGCKTSGAAIGAEQLTDPKAAKASSKSKFKGGRKIY